MTKVKNIEEKLTLSAELREVFGKSLRKLRKESKLPGNIYGADFKSMAITFLTKDFINIYRKAKETGVVFVKTAKEEIPVLIKNLQRHPVVDQILHIDFRKIDLTKKIETEVPVVVIGTSDAVAHKNGVLITQHDHLLVEALPTDIPKEIEIDITVLKEVGQDIKVSDLPKSDKYTIKNEPETVIVSVTEHKEESLTPETTAVETEVITEKVGEEGAEGTEAATPAEEGKKEEGKKEEKAEKPAEEKKEPKKE